MKNPWEEFQESSTKFTFPPIKYLYIALFAILIIWLSNGIVQVKTGQEGLVLRFGKFNRKMNEGLNFFIPNIESIVIEDVQKIRSLEGNNKLDQNNSIDIKEGIFTGDKNLVCIKYKI